VLIKRPKKFGGFPTPTSTRINNDIEFNENLQLGNGLTNVLGAYNVQLKCVKGLFFLPQTFQILLGS